MKSSCHMNASCTNKVGSFTCACNQGYSGDGVIICDGEISPYTAIVTRHLNHPQILMNVLLVPITVPLVPLVPTDLAASLVPVTRDTEEMVSSV